MRSRSLLSPGAMVLASTVGFSFKGIFARLAYAEGLSVDGVLLLRVALATPLFVLGARLFAGPLPTTSRRDLGRALLAGVLFAGATASDFLAIHALGAGISRVLLFTFPLWVMLLEALLRRRWPERRRLTGFAVTWVGLGLLFVPTGPSSGRALGPEFLWGLAAAVSYAVYLVVSGPLTQRLGSMWFAASSNVGTGLAVGLGVALFAPASPAELGAGGLFYVALMVVFSTVLPFFLLFEGIRRTDPERASLWSLAGPVITVAVAFFILGERLTVPQLGGVALVLAGVHFLRAPLGSGARGAEVLPGADPGATLPDPSAEAVRGR